MWEQTAVFLVATRASTALRARNPAPSTARPSFHATASHSAQPDSSSHTRASPSSLSRQSSSLSCARSSPSRATHRRLALASPPKTSLTVCRQPPSRIPSPQVQSRPRLHRHLFLLRRCLRLCRQLRHPRRLRRPLSRLRWLIHPLPRLPLLLPRFRLR